MSKFDRRVHRHQEKPREDSRIVYGARCSWWDSIDQAASLSGLPVCPRCVSPLFEIKNEAEWWRQVDHHQQVTEDETYREFVAWMRGKCFPGWLAARTQFDKERAIKVDRNAERLYREWRAAYDRATSIDDDEAWAVERATSDTLIDYVEAEDLNESQWDPRVVENVTREFD